MEEFKVGDWIEITKSNTCWNKEMDKFVGHQFQITHIGQYKSGDSIKFKNTLGKEFDHGWNWCYSWGHFKKINQEPQYEIY